MKKIVILLSIALASMVGASAQSVLFKNLVVKPGGESFIEFTITDVTSWEDYSGMQFGIPVPEGVKPGSKRDIDFGGLLLEGDLETTIQNADIKLVRDNPDFDFEGTYIYFSLTGGYSNLSYEGEDDVTIKLPIIVSEEAEEVTEFEMDLDAVKQSFLFPTEGFQYDFVDEQQYVNGLITISSGFTGTIYDPRAVSADKNFETEDELKAVLSKTENTIVEFAVEVPREWAKLPNVVVKGRAKEIILSNKEAYSYTNEKEKGFMAQKVSFIYNFSVKANKAGGWNSMVIPFDGKPEIEPFTDATATTGKFWAKQFYRSEEKGLIFENLEDAVFMSNQAYILAFPGEFYGENEFEGNSLLITGEDVWVAHSVPKDKLGGAPYPMIINYGGKTSSPNAYVLDSEKNAYVYCETPVDVVPFSAFAVRAGGDANADELEMPDVFGFYFPISIGDDKDNSNAIEVNNGRSIDFPLDGRTLKAGWHTLCLPFNLTAEQIAADDCPLKGAAIRTLKSCTIEGSVLTIAFEDATSIEAGKPYIVRPESAIENPSFEDVTIRNVNPSTVSVTQGVATFIGTYAPVTLATADGDKRKLFLKDNNLYYPDGATSINAFRAYFTLSEDAPTGNLSRAIIDFGDGETTSLSPVEHGVWSMENLTGAWHDLQGRRIEKPVRKGIYVRNGQKVVIK